MGVPLGPKLLLVNDDEDGLFLLERAAAKKLPEAVLIKCRDGHSALATLEAEHFDGVVTDNRMPEMNGLCLVQAIRQRYPMIPILMVTGSPNIEADARTAGVTGFMANGTWEEIGEAIRKLVT